MARVSLDELLLDYEDHLRQRGLPLWTKDDPPALAVRAVGMGAAPGAADYAPWLDHREAGVVANAIICLIHQANYLLDRQVAALERDFIREGGYSEKLAGARQVGRRKMDRTDPTDRTEAKPPLPACPLCARRMARRTAR